MTPETEEAMRMERFWREQCATHQARTIEQQAVIERLRMEERHMKTQLAQLARILPLAAARVRLTAAGDLKALALAIVMLCLPVAASAAQLTLTWTDTNTLEAGTAIERAPAAGSPLAPSGPFIQISSVIADVVTYADLTVTAGGSYCYRIAAFNADAVSPYSNTACGTAPLNAPGTIIISLLGAGQGRVTSTPAGINCSPIDTRCQATYPVGTVVSLAASPFSLSRFASWGGGCHARATCRVTALGTVRVSAEFEPR